MTPAEARGKIAEIQLTISTAEIQYEKDLKKLNALGAEIHKARADIQGIKGKIK